MTPEGQGPFALREQNEPHVQADMQGKLPEAGAKPRSRAALFSLAGAGLAFALAGGGWAARLLVDAGTFDRVWTHHPAMQCTIHKGLPGVEDIVRIGKTSRVIATSQTRVLREGESFSSGFYMYNVSTPSTPPRALTPPQGEAFSPHGVGYFPDAPETGTSTSDGARGHLAVVNHRAPSADGDAIEVFRVDGETVTHVQTRTFPGIRTMNSVQPLGNDAFYFTTDFGSLNPFMQMIEKFLRIGRGGVYFSRGSELKRVVSGLLFANGLTLSPDGTKLYVAEMLARSLHVYDIDATSGSLRETRNHFLDTAPDNIRLDESGQLFVAAHPRLLDLSAHSKAPWKARSPSQVLVVRGVEGDAEVEEFLSDPGVNLSAVSTALRIGDHLLMGTIYSDGLYDCRLLATPQ